MSTLGGAFERFRTNYDGTELTPYSIQEALRIYLQPIKNDDPHLDFYTMYKRETVEYDTEYMQKYNEDLNTTLIFVRSSFPLIVMRANQISGGSVLRRQCRLHRWRPTQARARLSRTVRSLSSSDSTQPQPIHFSRRDP